MTLFRGQQSKAARDRERERSGGETPIVHHEEAAPQACRLMDDEVVKMLIFKGRLVSGEQGLRGNFVCLFIYGFVLFQATTGSRRTVQSVGKEIPDQGKKTNWERGRGEKKKSSKKTQVSKYIRNTSAPSVRSTHITSHRFTSQHSRRGPSPRRAGDRGGRCLLRARRTGPCARLTQAQGGASLLVEGFAGVGPDEPRAGHPRPGSHRRGRQMTEQSEVLIKAGPDFPELKTASPRQLTRAL